MKVFISWSGEHSRKLGEALRDWLPGVLQLRTPYFTPADIEKGSRWSTDISKELSDSQIGILCVTRENIHSDWILFEAGALSKSLDKSYVCPILFGITNTDLAGPLKQFQTTEFEKGDMRKLIGVINSRLEENKLPQKTLDKVFDKWWPDLENKIQEILEVEDVTDEPVRSDREILEEILQLNRASQRMASRSSGISKVAIAEILSCYIELHETQVMGEGGYQESLDILKKMRRAIRYVLNKYRGDSPTIKELSEKFETLNYEYIKDNESDEDDEIPF